MKVSQISEGIKGEVFLEILTERVGGLHDKKS
jgi:hypothetical protein